MFRRSLFVATTVLAALAPAGAWAAETREARARVIPVAVALGDNARERQGVLQQALESGLRKSPRVEMVDPTELFDGSGVAARRQARQRASDAIAFGRRSYDNLEEGLGLESFNRAVAAYEDSALWEGVDGLLEAMVMRVAVRWSDDPVSARKELAQLVALAPDVQFPAEVTPPELAQEVQQAKERLRPENSVSLDVLTTPVPARVYLDGVLRGTSPLSIQGLTQGEHYLSLVAPGYAVEQLKVRATPGSTKTVALHPLETAEPLLRFASEVSKRFGEDDEVNLAGAFAREIGADAVLVGSVKRGGGRLTFQLHRIAADGHVEGIETVEVAERDPMTAGKLESALLKMLAKERPRGSKGEPQGLRSGFGRVVNSVAKVDVGTVKMGVLIGGGALLTAGLITGAVGLAKESSFRNIPQSTPDLREQQDAIRSTAIAADVLMLSGIAAAGVWSYLQFGRTFAKKTAIEAPVIDQKKEKEAEPEPGKKKPAQPAEDDPFAAAPATGANATYQASLLPLSGGLFVGLGGSF